MVSGFFYVPIPFLNYYFLLLISLLMNFSSIDDIAAFLKIYISTVSTLWLFFVLFYPTKKNVILYGVKFECQLSVFYISTKLLITKSLLIVFYINPFQSFATVCLSSSNRSFYHDFARNCLIPDYQPICKQGFFNSSSFSVADHFLQINKLSGLLYISS